ncbi:hypothetical protein ACFQZJ_11695 [Maribacter chungangensis]|uniref:Lipoprotein n=1 Tax=Maribacter chungangensis TaxID=1069117 RepID=A0ABW3B4Y4_9FLAO
MKYFKLLAVLIFSAVVSLTSCKDAAKAPKQETSPPANVAEPFTPPSNPTQNIATPEPAQNAMGVWHYTCAQGCAGGAGSPINCATCGALLAHNQGYHTNPNNAPMASPPLAAAPAQNAAGIWHYSCSKGCAGGSGTAGNCSTCGDALAHNTAYH